MRWLVVLAVGGLLSCADVCARGEALHQSFPNRHTACFEPGSLPNAGFDTTRCDDSMNACSAADETTLHAYFDCVERLPTCTQKTRSTFSESFLKCTGGMRALSPGCFQL